VSTTRVVRSLPFLDAAAIAAVTQWQFTPTIVDGRAVPVIMTLSVGFKRSDAAASPHATVAPAEAPTPPIEAPVAPPPPPRPSPPAVAPPRTPSPDADLETAFDELQRRQYEDAVKAFRAANDRRSQNCAVCWLGVARAYEGMGAAKNVVDACERAVA